ncbi:hypothetical protein HZF02_23830 [Pseudomonas yamanorum]|nr:hypothetical protein HZF02_23830 [Pseudomonas yamanorum]
MKYVLALALMTIASSSNAACSLSDIKLTSMKTKFVNKCSDSECIYLQGAAMLENKCAEPVGVQVQIVGYDKAGTAVATNEFWPASVRNIPPGNYSFSLDQHLKYDPSIENIALELIDVRKWK